MISSTNSVDLHFYEGVEKIKENNKNTKIENLQNGQEKYGGKNLAYLYSWGKNFKKNYSFFKLKFEIVLNSYLDKFLTWNSLHLAKETLNALRKIQFTIRNELLKHPVRF